MRRQGELRVLYPRLDRHNQNFILAQLDELASTFDSDELLGFLHSLPILRGHRDQPEEMQRFVAVIDARAPESFEGVEVGASIGGQEEETWEGPVLRANRPIWACQVKERRTGRCP